MKNPRYMHDCDQCLFLGTYDFYDLYYCDKEPTIICRFTNDPCDYSSGLVFAIVENAKPQYVAALKLALKTEYRNRIIEWLKKYECGNKPGCLERLEQLIKETE